MDAATTLRRLAILSAAVLGFAASIALTGHHGSASAAGASPSIAALRICTNCASTGGDLSRYRYVVLNAWDHDKIAALHAANPNVKVLVYKDLAGTLAYACHNGTDDALLAAGVGYCAAAASHPDWFLSDTAGNRIEFCDYPGVWQMDPGNAGYQDAWLSNVSSELSKYGWDGVMIDDTNSTERNHLCGRTISRYPTDADYEGATRSFLARVGPALMSQKFLVLPNINYDCWETCWTNFIRYTSGGVREWWSKSTTGSGGQYSDAGWNWANGFLRLTQQQGKIFVGITYAPVDDVRSQRYARASFLLDWDGGPSAMVFEPTPEATDPYLPDWTADVGTPTGAKYQVGSAWRRDYSGGTVVVNPSASATATVALNATYLAADGTSVTSVSLAPMTAAILRAAAPTAPTSTATTTTPTTTTTSTTTAPPPPTTTTTAVATTTATPTATTTTTTTTQTKPTTTTAPTTSTTGTTTTTTSTSTVAPPVDLTPPTVSLSKDRSLLTESPGQWKNASSYRFQWLRCDAVGGACAPIAGATSTTYQLTAADVGKTLCVAVTATGAGGSATVISNRTALVIASGKPKVRTLASAVSGGSYIANGWGGIVSHRRAWQWFGVRVDARHVHVAYLDRRSGIRLRVVRVESARLVGKTLLVRGEARVRGKRVAFALRVVDRHRTRDVFRISLGKRYVRAGRVATGNVVIR